MKLAFYKYQGTGNDFIIIDNREHLFDLADNSRIARLCDRHFGIGADGFMLLQNSAGYDFEMVYYNSDGRESTMCGNGGRCMAAFARKLGIPSKDGRFRFTTIDGEHHALIKEDWVSLKMNDVREIEQNSDFYFLNTGSPHYVKFVSGLEHYNVVEEGKNVRYNGRFKETGTNVNFIEKLKDSLFVRTYERGVEGETFSCGTGVTAAAIVASIAGKSSDADSCLIKTIGGNLVVRFNRKADHAFENIWLEGPATFVFQGEIECCV